MPLSLGAVAIAILVVLPIVIVRNICGGCSPASPGK